MSRELDDEFNALFKDITQSIKESPDAKQASITAFQSLTAGLRKFHKKLKAEREKAHKLQWHIDELNESIKHAADCLHYGKYDAALETLENAPELKTVSKDK